VKKQQFRADLLARVSGITLQLPPLRQRRADVLPLFLRFMRELRQGHTPELEPELVERLVLHDWPFNVRELLQLARRLAVLQSAEAMLRAQCLPREMQQSADPTATSTSTRPAAAPTAPHPTEAPPTVDLERLLTALRETGGNVTRAAAELGITRQRAYRLLEEQSVDLASISSRRRPSR
jgi:DNA-binding NtrC family response regulator